MATITTGGSGDWTSTTNNAPWPGGTLPTAADTVTIANTHTVTLNSAVAAVALSVTVNTGGSLTSNGTNIVSLTIQNGLTQQTGSTVSIDYTGDVTKTFTLTLNNVRAAAASAFNFFSTGTATTILKGFAKTRWTTLSAGVSAAATTASVTAATGWQTGDKICFATTQAYNATPRVDMSTGTNTVSGTSLSNLTAFTYNHADGGYVGNFSSNLVIKPNTTNDALAVRLEQNGSTRTGTRTITDVEFNGFGAATFPNNALTMAASFTGADGSGTATPYTRIGNNCFYDCRGSAGIHMELLNTPVPRDNNIFYLPSLSTAGYAVSARNTSMGYVGDDTDTVVFRSSGGGIATSFMAGSVFTRPKISSCTATPTAGSPNSAIQLGGGFSSVTDADIFSNKFAFITVNGEATLSTCRIGTQYSGASTNETVFFGNNLTEATLTDCQLQTGGTFGTGLTTTIPGWFLQLKNKNADPAVQEIYNLQSNTVAAIQRDASTTSRSTSSVAMTCNTSTAINYSFDVLAKAGQTITLLTLVRKSSSPAYGASTLPKVTVSGLGITPVVSTMDAGTAADTWETLTTSATNSTSADGSLTVTLTAQSATAGAKAYFAGLPVAPFVTRCRHYGYMFDETNPVRTTNITVSASEATAAAYTGMTVTWGTSSSPTTITADNTFQKLYDYTQAQGCLNVGSAMPLTGAGVAGNPSLFAAANVTINTTKVLNGAGSISMGSYTLTTEFSGAVAYTYTGGTWSQLTTVPAFSGGTVNLGASGTYVFTLTDAIASMTPTAPSTYNMSGITVSGTIDLRNTTAHAITVQLPSGTSYTTASNPGGTITVTTPAIYQSVTVTGATAGSRIQIYDTDAATELYNGTPAFPYTWTDGSAASADRPIRLRVSYVSGVTAKTFIDANIGTCGVTSGDAGISYLVSQVDDDTYITNGIDGPAIYATSGITFTDAATDLVNCNIAGGSVTYATIYACFVYWLSTSTGIADDITYIDAPDTANYIFTSMEIKNTIATPLTVTGGYGRDSVSGLSKDIVDAAGSTGNIYLAPDHVIPYSTGSGLTAGQAAQLTSIDAACDAQISDVPAAVIAVVVDGSTTMAESFRLQNAVLAGKVSGAGTGTETFRDLADTKDRIVATVDSSGNRTAITRDAS